MYLIVKYDDNGMAIPNTLNLKNHRMTLHYSNGKSENFFPDMKNDIWESEITDKIYKGSEIVKDIEQILIISYARD